MLQCIEVCVAVCIPCGDLENIERVAVHCSVLRCVAVCCSVLQCVAVCCSVLQCVAVGLRISSKCVTHLFVTHMDELCVTHIYV